MPDDVILTEIRDRLRAITPGVQGLPPNLGETKVTNYLDIQQIEKAMAEETPTKANLNAAAKRKT